MDNIRKLPAQLNTTQGLGHTINTNFQSLEQLYTDLKYAFGGLNFIQLYGEIPYKGGDTTATINWVQVTYRELDYDSLPSTTPGSSYLASYTINDTNNKLGLLNTIIEKGTFIVSTNKGWKTYNPVYTTSIFRPSNVSVEYTNRWEYQLKYNYELFDLPKDKDACSASITMNYLDINQTVGCNDITAWVVWKNSITLNNSYPTAGLAVRLEGPDGEVDYLSYTVLSNSQIQVEFFPTTGGPYKIHIHYGYRPKENS